MYKKVKKFFGAISPFLKKIEDDNIFAISGQSAFFLLLALIPFAMFAVSILQNLNIPVSKFDRFFRIIFNDAVSAQISNFLGNVNKGSVSVPLITMFFTLWSAAQGVHAITSGLNRIHHTYENRNWFLVRFRAMFYTVVFVFILFATAFVIVLGSSIQNAIAQHVPELPNIVAVLYRFRFIIIFIYLVFLFSFIYRNLPNLTPETRAEYKFIYQLPGSLLCAAAWILLSWGISIYVGDFNGFSIYGSLSKVAVMMVWLYFCILFLMFGAEINCHYHVKIKHFIDNKILRKNKKKKY
ncbi:MAG: YihY/virulence factor BrkB family protein [Oscillospiraceae bacterium]|nr:YihY/virulence factor BrkB family protein [Oscillospiraceae bacterium]